MFSTILRRFSLVVNPGDVVMISGASGSGKSTVIKLLTRQHMILAREMRVYGRLKRHDVRNVALLSTNLGNRWPLVDQVGLDLPESIRLLNAVGLAEAHIYLKRPRQILEGQKYRFAAAKLCDSRKPLWVADEFASTLDAETSAILAKGLRRLAWTHGATLILAAAHIEGFVDSLLPNKLVELRWGEIARILSVRLRHKERKGRLHLWIHNNGRADIAEAVIGGIDAAGGLEPFQKLQKIERGARSVPIEVNKADLSDFNRLVVRTGCGVGDVLYLTTISGKRGHRA